MTIFYKYGNRWHISIQVGLNMLYKNNGSFAFPFSFSWFSTVDVTSVIENLVSIKHDKRYYNFLMTFLCFYFDVQADVYEK